MNRIKKIAIIILGNFYLFSTYYVILEMLNSFNFFKLIGMFSSLFCCILLLLTSAGFNIITEYLSADKDKKIKEKDKEIKELWNFLSEEQRKEYNLKIEKENYLSYQEQLKKYHEYALKSEKRK